MPAAARRNSFLLQAFFIPISLGPIPAAAYKSVSPPSAHKTPATVFKILQPMVPDPRPWHTEGINANLVAFCSGVIVLACMVFVLCAQKVLKFRKFLEPMVNMIRCS